MRFFFFLLLSIGVCTAQAQVYVWTNEQGVRVYGDEPPAEQGEKAQLPKLQPLKHLKLDTDKPAKPDLEIKDDTFKPAFQGYRVLSIINPTEDSMLTSGAAGNLNVQLQLEPALAPGHEIRLLLDGKLIEQGPSLQFTLENINRGAHLLQAQIKHKGQLFISSEKRRFHVQRPSILSRPTSR